MTHGFFMNSLWMDKDVFRDFLDKRFFEDNEYRNGIHVITSEPHDYSYLDPEAESLPVNRSFGIRNHIFIPKNKKLKYSTDLSVFYNAGNPFKRVVVFVGFNQKTRDMVNAATEGELVDITYRLFRAARVLDMQSL